MSSGPRDAHTISPLTATCIVVANMVGTGIFTSLGFQVRRFADRICDHGGLDPGGFARFAGRSLMRSWGRRCRARAANIIFWAKSIIQRSVFSPAGFRPRSDSRRRSRSRPWLSALTSRRWCRDANPLLLSLAVVTICTLVLLRDLQLGSAFQNGSTILKVVLILVIIGAGFWVTTTQPVSFLPAQGRRRFDPERAVRGQPLLGDVCLLGMERLDLHRRRSAQSVAHHSALGRAGHGARHGPLPRD